MAILANIGGLDPDIWYLIIRNLDTKNDIYNLCLVSKSLSSLAITHLYNTLEIGRKPLEKSYFIQTPLPSGKAITRLRSRWTDFLSLVHLLVENPSGPQAHAVREIEAAALIAEEDDIVSDYDDYYEHYNSPDYEQRSEAVSDFQEKNVVSDFVQQEALAKLVKALPNLQQFRLYSEKLQFEDLIAALDGHDNHPQLHLLNEIGLRSAAGPISCVTSLHAKVNPYVDSINSPNRRIPDLQKLFFACPNLKSFSLSSYGNYGGCMRRSPRHPQVYSFELTGKEIFPPLESLSLDGYRMSNDEWNHWRDNLNWSNLRSLSLGPQHNALFLERFTGFAKNLRSLTVKTWDRDAKDFCPELKDFLMSFDTLEELTVRGHFVSKRTLSNHPRLKRLCLHTFERDRNGVRRQTLDAAGLSELDANCPNLETLEIDIYRDSEWPKDITRTLASGFANLRHLSLHCEVGIDWGRAEAGHVVLPKLDEDLAKAFGKQFFAWRPQSKLKMVTLHTGESLRRFPQWTPAYVEFERKRTETIQIRAPSSAGEEPVVNTVDF